MKDRVDRKLCLGSFSLVVASVGNLNRVGEKGKNLNQKKRNGTAKAHVCFGPAFTFLKPAHMWNRQASLKHAIEQNDESPRGHPGHSTMARPSGPNAGSAHVLHASPQMPKCKKGKGETRKKLLKRHLNLERAFAEDTRTARARRSARYCP
jgi:hypothetical protein